MKPIPETIRIYNGRRKYLARLRQLQDERRRLVAAAWAEAVKDGGPVAWGTWSRLAVELGYSRQTIARDLKAVQAEALAADAAA